jgi:hypothetical protein
MLKGIITLALVLTLTQSHAQTIIQLTQQLAFDVQKLASIKSTLQEMYQGYENLEKGYTRVRDIVKDNFNLHEVFLDALWVVSQSVRNDPRLEEIVNTEYRIVALYKTATLNAGSNPVWSPTEFGYINGAFGAVLTRSQQAIDELTMVTTDNELRMSDAERLSALDRIDTELQQELAFLEQFNNELAIETTRRNQEMNDVKTLKSLYGLSN